MKEIIGKSYNPGKAEGEAIVFETGFSFIGDMSPTTGEVTMARHPHFGKSLKDKVLIFRTGRGGTIAPYMLYYAKKNGVAPCAILCDKVDMLTLECALTVDIPILDGAGHTFTTEIGTGSWIEIDGDLCKIKPAKD